MSAFHLLLCLTGAASLGFLIGLERSRRIKTVGARTFSLISLGGAVAGLIAARFGAIDPSVLGRVLQGVLMGVGFVGAGVIIHPAGRSVHGVTTAAAIWVTAGAGFAVGVGEWVLAAGAAVLTLAILAAPEPWRAPQLRTRREPPRGRGED